MPNDAGLALLAGPDLRDEGDRAFGAIPCRFESEVRYLRTLKAGPVRAWKATLTQTVTKTIAGFDIGPGKESIDNIVSLGLIGTDVALDLVVSYDVKGALGGREWLEENADDREIYTILKAIVAVHFPFVNDVMSLISSPVLRALMTSMTPDAPSDPPSSPSGPLPPGTSTPPTSKPASTKRS